MKTVSIMTPCFNEEANIDDLYRQVKSVTVGLKGYRFEHVFIDNASHDSTVAVLKKLARNDNGVRIIVNSKNFGAVRSSYHGLLQCTGDAVIPIAADLQDPPALIANFIKKWEEGYKVIIAVKSGTKENILMSAVRKFYYNLARMISETEHIKNFTGYGLYDRSFVDELRKLNDPYPYFRGLVSELGFARAEVPFIQPKRLHGKSSYNFYRLFDIAMLGFVSSSKVPLRLATLLGFFVATISLLVAIGYFVYKIIFWYSFNIGMAPLVIGLFFFSSVQLFFIGIVGEYIGAIYTQVRKRPLVIEKERIQFAKKNKK